MSALLEARGLHAGYGETRVLHGIDFAVEAGGVTALLGANGAGKTTTLRAICGMVRTTGEIRLGEERIDGKATGGEQQMLAIARALLLRPRLLLLDEPSFGLAPLIVQEIFAIMHRIREDEGVSILLVEQNASLALEIAEQAYLLETGRIVVSGPAAEIRRDDSIRRSYLGY
jgi:ABC-type branched-subunit amino acid transport system ATPase component